MSKSVNQAILMGRLTADVDLRATKDGGKSVASFTLAVDRFGNDAGTDFFDVTAWDKLAELMSKYTNKGSKVLVMGRMQQQTWQDKESGKNRSKVVVVANDVTFLDGKSESSQQNDVVVEDIDDKPIDLSEIPF